MEATIWLPELTLASAPATVLRDQFGGAPFAFQNPPRCSVCGEPLILVAQLLNAPGRLELGAEDRVLRVFACAGLDGCEPTDAFEANEGRCSVISRAIPQASDRIDSPGAAPEAHVLRWRTMVFDPDAPATSDRPATSTRIGGQPCAFRDFPTEVDRHRFALQLSGLYEGVGEERVDGANLMDGLLYVYVDPVRASAVALWDPL